MNRTEIYNRITDKLIAKMEAGVVPWRRSWKIGSPVNFVSGRRYNGINFLSLIAEDHPCPYYLTFLQAKERGAFINKGATGSLIVFWKMYERDIEEENKGPARVPFLRYSYAFNLSQTSLYSSIKPESTGITSAEELISQMHNLPPIKNNYQRCVYNITEDCISLPVITDFETETEYYSSLFHEAIHSTGHSSRLNRISAYASKDEYSEEELIAEIGSAYLCSMCGISNEVIDNQAAYLHGWMKQLKHDPAVLVRAALHARSAVELLLSSSPTE